MTRRSPTDPALLDPHVVELSEREGDDDGLDTAIASFFDGDYVSPRSSDADLGRSAKQRAAERRMTPPLLLRR